MVGNRSNGIPEFTEVGRYVTTFEGSRLGKVSVRNERPRVVGPGGTRGRVVAFSRTARKRLLERVLAIDTVKSDPLRWLFITLTYPGQYSEKWEHWKRDLDTFWKRWVRHFGEGWSCFWKLEPQRRGAPHFHLIVIPPRGYVLADIRGWLSRIWYEVVGSGDERHLRAGTNVERVRSHKGAVAYAAKYCGKTCAFFDQVTGEAKEAGRFWGVLGRENLQIRRVVYHLSERQHYQLRRILRRVWAPSGMGARTKGCAVYMSPKCWKDVLEHLGAWRLSEAAVAFFCGRGELLEICGNRSADVSLFASIGGNE